MRTKLGLVGLCAVMLGMMAISVGSAQALTLDWLVLDPTGNINTLIQFSPPNLLVPIQLKKDTSHLTLLTKILKLMVSVTCTSSELVGGVHLTENGLTLGRVKFTGCAVYSGAGLGTSLPCTVKTVGAATGTVESANATSKLVLHTLAGGGTEVLLEISPDVGTTFATLLFEGAECALPLENTVNGSLFLRDCLKLATTHALSHLIEQGPLTKLFVGADTVEHLETSLVGSSFVQLVGSHDDRKWAAMVTP